MFRIIAVVALFISFLPDLGLLLGGGRSPAPGGPSIGGANALSVGILMLMHIVAAAISVGLLTTLTREK